MQRYIFFVKQYANRVTFNILLIITHYEKVTIFPHDNDVGTYLGASADMGKHGGSDVPANETGHTKVCPYKISPFKNVADTAAT